MAARSGPTVVAICLLTIVRDGHGLTVYRSVVPGPPVYGLNTWPPRIMRAAAGCLPPLTRRPATALLVGFCPRVPRARRERVPELVGEGRS